MLRPQKWNSWQHSTDKKKSQKANSKATSRKDLSSGRKTSPK